MSKQLSISLVLFAIIWLCIIWINVRRQRIAIKDSLVWIFASIVIFLLGACPWTIEWIKDLAGFEEITNFVIGILFTLLMLITLFLTIIVSKQKTEIKTITQELSLLKRDLKKKNE